ncbi:cytochrome P450 [Gemmatirosa kalamazoonensis]|uniref:Cytochrome P450 n=1 Tax=Gemmatirosa kalamazoonensis TaxID=861299 RepID=W0REI2_9BACT|nr:cytochrome P450 [Gemmatirosa kalamazoonensis]AHG88725.1 cytochrome P450 [Gemmatirosa kalamazoonensis]
MISQSATPKDTPLPTASLADTLGVLADVVLPTLAKGVIIRRPRAIAIAERLDLDRRAVRRLQRLRDRYGAGPVLLRLPGRVQAVVLAPEHVRRVLAATPEPFAAASSEKRAALSHFEPHGVLISHGAERVERRRFNDTVLESERPRHALAEGFVGVVREEMGRLLETVGRDGTLDWAGFAAAWFRVVRRVTLGDGARDDEELTDLLADLRGDANWGPLRPKRRPLRDRFLARLAAHVARAEPGSLASVAARVPTLPGTDPAGQVPQWLFAFDAAGMATFRALALLATHPAHEARAREELGGAASAGAPELPYLRACVLESVRLWPTTPMVLRQSTGPTTWEGGAMPAGAGVLIFTPFFHRDDARLPFADRLAPEVWLGDGPAPAEWPLIPFSGGPGICPGRQVVLLLASAALAVLLAGRRLAVRPPVRLNAGRPLPATLSPFRLRFSVVE